MSGETKILLENCCARTRLCGAAPKLSRQLWGLYVKCAWKKGLKFGLIGNIIINDDNLVRQHIRHQHSSNYQRIIVTRNLPVEISVLCVGFGQDGKKFHRLPPRPPLSLDALYLSDDAELVRFTSAGRYGYFRHILRLDDQPVEEILTAHLANARLAHAQHGRADWYTGACQELIVLLRDDYEGLMNVLNALAELE